MKFLVVLALAVVATQAAFTGSLVEQVHPLIATLKIHSAARNSAQVNMQTELGEAISNHITNIVAQIDQQVAGLQAALGAAISHGINTAQNIHNGVQAAVAQAQTVFVNFLQSILNAGNQKGAIPDWVITIIQSFYGSEEFAALREKIRNTQLYKCLEGKGIVIEYENMVDIYHSGEGQLTQWFNDHGAQINQCIDEVGVSNIHAALAKYIPIIQYLVAALPDVAQIVKDFVLTNLPFLDWDTLIKPLAGFKRGIFSGISSGASQLVEALQNTIQNAVTQLMPTIEAIKEKVQQYIANAIANAVQIGQGAVASAQQAAQQAAQDILEVIKPFLGDSSALYQQIVNAVAEVQANLGF